MLNGRDHPAGKGLVVNGHGARAQSEPETSDLYGDYEQKLADELSELLRGSGTTQPAAVGAVAAQGRLPRAQPEPAMIERAAAYSPSAASALEQAAPGRPRAVVPAGRPRNDFAADDDPLPFSWRHEARPPQSSWVARQMKAGLIGLAAGLVIVLPAVAVFSGKLDPWLPVQRASMIPAPAEVAETPKPLVQPAEPRLFDVARMRSEPVVPPTPPPTVPATAPATATAPAETSPPVAPVPVPARSVGTIEAFPAATPAARSADTSPSPVATPPTPAPAARPQVTLALPPAAPDAGELLAQGLKLVKAGDVASARTPLAKAASMGNADAMMALGETFDPNMLAAWAARDVKSDASTARMFYARAGAAGHARAKARLDALN